MMLSTYVYTYFFFNIISGLQGKTYFIIYIISEMHPEQNYIFSNTSSGMQAKIVLIYISISYFSITIQKRH
jgi:hypothetical protein